MVLALPCTLAEAVTDTLMLAWASAAMAIDDVAQATPLAPISPSALNVATVFEAKSAIGSLRERVSANADLMSPICAWSTPFNSSSPVTVSVAEESQLAGLLTRLEGR